ncbi:hypothetical protein SVIO_108810 [Streptomyces violaceusniger]|uniref:Aminoglycoside phosphotransferase domain-containing protein n=1 Tax=Streptomyces violaceusniger TaxID=68280 RepID=A0A4D4LP81_STRVO|nr:hypothetical protein SVIO_108810 [Streptomyces violaceusniger]
MRMQRMDPTPELQLKERRWLPVLAPRLPLPVPTPVRFGEPSERFPKHWTVMTMVPGEPLDHGSISRGAHASDTLAGFLRALHVEAPAEAPITTDRGAHPRNCTADFENFFQAVAPDDIAADVRAVWDGGHGLTALRHVRSCGRCGDPARPRAGRDEEPLPDAHGAERRSGPSRRQAELGTCRPRGT